MKGGCHVYQPYWHWIITKGDVHRIKISEVELMEWYDKRAHVRQSGLGWKHIESAMLDLLKDKPYMHSDAPRPAVEEPEPPTDDDSDDKDNYLAPPSIDDESENENNDPPPLMEENTSDDESSDDLVFNEQLGEQSERDDYGPPHRTTS
jgi:hypothetical protein